MADQFPGLIDGIFIDATFPDALLIAMSAMDSKLLNKALVSASVAGLTEAQIVKVSGHKTARAWYDLAVQSGRTDPVSGRVETISTTGSLSGGYASGAFNAAVPASQHWDAVTNPTGARATVFDVGRNVYGIDAKGYGRRPFDNVGELVARCLHDYGSRKSGRFAALNCGGIPETLFESEVFGHEAGAFTGAAKRRIGKVEHATGGRSPAKRWGYRRKRYATS